ncbi:hypothetical protein M2128_000668 [Polynucleobacter sphagniphilus]|uniref:hypothetical protein n=1 Tax=Polynucleobacter sphagniphilus TaxID=1743169 RepID=UPI002475B9E8|nr:hypothetical protein [Polynucleobacter sphagniphilus]MDH6301751.1 hypothetical protein [Polynucleobacter sphagniphilus]
MNPIQIIERAKYIGVSLHLTDKHSIRFKGESQAINEVMPLLQTHKAKIIEWLEFCDLYEFLVPKKQWTDADHQWWCKDLIEQPKLTIDCLRALQNAYEAGRAMTNEDMQ